MTPQPYRPEFHTAAKGEIERVTRQRNRAYGFIAALIVLGGFAFAWLIGKRYRFFASVAVTPNRERVVPSANAPNWAMWPYNPSCDGMYVRYGVTPDIGRLVTACNEHDHGGSNPVGERIVQWQGRTCIEYSWNAVYTECAVLCGQPSSQ